MWFWKHCETTHSDAHLYPTQMYRMQFVREFFFLRSMFSVMWNSTLERSCVRAFAVIKFRLYWWWCFCFPPFIWRPLKNWRAVSTHWGWLESVSSCVCVSAPIRNSLVFYFDALRNWNACNLKLDLCSWWIARHYFKDELNWIRPYSLLVVVRRLEGYSLFYALCNTFIQ